MAKKIALFGDSILRGVIYGDDKRYHISKEIDWRGIEETLDIELENFSKMGNCIESGRINLEKFLADCKDVKGVVLEYGGNDSDYFWEQVSRNPSKDNLPKTVLAEFRRDLTLMIALLKKNRIRPILMTLPPIIAERYFNFIVSLGNDPTNIKKFLGDVQIIYRRHELYSNEIVKIAREQNVDLVDVRSRFLQSNNLENLICEDGIHPNTEGQKLIVHTFSAYFDNEKLRARRKKVAKKSEKQQLKEQIKAQKSAQSTEAKNTKVAKATKTCNVPAKISDKNTKSEAIIAKVDRVATNSTKVDKRAAKVAKANAKAAAKVAEKTAAKVAKDEKKVKNTQTEKVAKTAKSKPPAKVTQIGNSLSCQLETA